MTKHRFAINHQGRTLGITDERQLSRLLRLGELATSAKVFVLAEKKWVFVSEIPGLNMENETQAVPIRPVIAEVTPPPSMKTEAEKNPEAEKPAVSGVQPEEVPVEEMLKRRPTTRTREFAALMEEMEDTVSVTVGAKTETILPISNGDAADETRRTIHISSEEQAARRAMKEKQIIASVVDDPAEHLSRPRRYAILTAMAVLVLGLAAGYFSSGLLYSKLDSGPKVLQAQNNDPIGKAPEKANTSN